MTTKTPDAGAPARAAPRWRAVWRWLSRLVAAVVLVAVGVALWREVRGLSPAALEAAAADWGPGRIAAILGLTGASFTLLAVTEWLGVRWAGGRAAFPRVALASFCANALGHLIGYAVVVGGAVRLRIYGADGVGLAKVARASLYASISMGLGLSALGGLALLPAALGPHRGGPAGLPAALLLAPAGYMAACAVWRGPIGFGRWSLRLPSGPLAAAQVLLGLADNAVAAAIIWILLPGGSASFGRVGAAFAAGTSGGLASGVPAGAGVLETTILTLLSSTPKATVTAALLGYRLVYYLLPLAVAAPLLLRELAPGRLAGLRRRLPAAAPRLLGLGAFLVGAALILTSIGPIPPDRLALLRERVPLALLETAHLLSLLAGLALMAATPGLLVGRRTAVSVAAAAAALGASTAIVRGLDLGAAAASAALAVLAVAGRGAFRRPGGLEADRMPAEWAGAILAVLAGGFALGLWFYDGPLEARVLGQFGYAADPGRFLRGAALLGAAAVMAGAWRLARGAAPRARPASAETLRAIRPWVRGASDTNANLVLLGDKAVLLDAGGEGFLMYGASGRSLVAMGDPVGGQEAAQRLIWRFLELAHAAAARPVFYQVGAQCLTSYLDAGLTLLKLGEEARIPLEGSASPAGGAGTCARPAPARDGRASSWRSGSRRTRVR